MTIPSSLDLSACNGCACFRETRSSVSEPGKNPCMHVIVRKTTVNSISISSYHDKATASRGAMASDRRVRRPPTRGCVCVCVCDPGDDRIGRIAASLTRGSHRVLLLAGCRILRSSRPLLDLPHLPTEPPRLSFPSLSLSPSLYPSFSHFLSFFRPFLSLSVSELCILHRDT